MPLTFFYQWLLFLLNPYSKFNDYVFNFEIIIASSRHEKYHGRKNINYRFW